MAPRSYGQYCGITTAVELVAERWALLIIRDLLVGPRRYTDLKQGLPRIPTNILSARLKELQDAGVIGRVPMKSCGLVYELTDYGRELEPIVLALGRWGFQSLGDPAEDEVVTADSLTMALRTAFRPEGDPRPLDFQIGMDEVELRAQVADGELSVVQIAPPMPPVGGSLPSGEPQLRFAATPGIRHLMAGTLTPAEAVDQGVVKISRGGPNLLRRFAKLFRIEAALMMTEVANGVWVRQSEWVWTNSMVVLGDEGLVLVDPGIERHELDDLADEIERLGMPVAAGFSTHPHWDHLVWHGRFGDVPRYATAAGSEAANGHRKEAREGAAEEASDVPLQLIAQVTPLPADGGPIPGELIEHRAHAVGHAAILLADRGVLLAGDMLSDVLIPLFDPRQEDQLDAYESALDLLAGAVSQVDVVVPGHGSVAKGPEGAARLAADRAYLNALRQGVEPDDPRLEVDWMSGPHQGNLQQI